VIVAFALFSVIKTVNQLHKIALRNKEKIPDNIEIEVTEEVQVLREIRDLLIRQSSPNSYNK
jgi:large-conductance mechanosensitive channel